MTSSNTNYNISNSDGTITYVVNENETNIETPITMVGKGKPDYGEIQNTNFLQMTEHFASENEPRNPIEGMIWYKKDEETSSYELRICKDPTVVGDGKWDKVPQVHTESGGEEPANASNGDIWYNNSDHKLYIYDGVLTKWVGIGPLSESNIKNKVETRTLNRANYNTLTYTISSSVFEKDTNTSTITGVTSIGTLNLVTLKVMAKEFINGLYSSDVRSCCWIYKFVVQVRKTSSSTYTYEIIGSPDYELVGKTPNTNWNIDILKDSNDIQVIFTDQGSAVANSYISLGYNYEIMRI